MSALDWIFLAALAVAAFLGYRIRALRLFFLVFSVMGGIILANRWHEIWAKDLVNVPAPLGHLLAYAAVFFVGFVLILLAGWLLSMLVHAFGLIIFDRVVGVLLALVIMLLLTTAMIESVRWMDFIRKSAWYKGSTITRPITTWIRTTFSSNYSL
jgi:uncharacterized membrane protein required for colicin V production